MKILARVVAELTAASIPHCLIGAGALAAHGVARSTIDLDLLVADPACLAPSMWRPLEDEGLQVEVRRGDSDDPLAGIVRIAGPASRPVDVVVGRWLWQARIAERARPIVAGGVELPVALPADLVLLKLYAGGPQDAWDIGALLVDDDGTLAAQVDARVAELPPDARELWSKLGPASAKRT